MALFGLFKSKQERSVDDAMKKIGAQVFPGGEADIRRDCDRVNKIIAGKLPPDALRAFVSGCKTLVAISEAHTEESFVQSFVVRSENRITPEEAYGVLGYFVGECSAIDKMTIFAAQNGGKLPPELQQYRDEVSVTYAQGVTTDQLPKGHGEFGLEFTNPVPTLSIRSSNEYLARLRYRGHPVENTRSGSKQSPVTAGAVDIYQLTQNGQPVGTVYLCPYHKRTSKKAPRGFKLE